MSTQPRNAADSAHTYEQAAVVPSAGGDLDAAVRNFVETADAMGASRPATSELHGWMRQVADITRELFPGKFVVETGVDPEISDDVSLLIQVESTGGIDEIMALDARWRLGVFPIAPKWPGLFCLLIDAI